MGRHKSGKLDLADSEIQKAFAEGSGAEFDVVLSVEGAAELLGVSPKTIYAWRSEGRLDRCSRRRGRHVFIFRDRLIQEIFDG